MFATRTVVVFSPRCGPVRNMATLKQISMRLKAVTNIQKITKSMKMVSAAKYARAERELKAARPYGFGANAFFEKAEVTNDDKKPNHLVVAMTSDRGLCGGVHSNIAKGIRNSMPDRPENTKLICVGDKSRSILGRLYPNNILMHFVDIGKKPPTFDDAGVVASEILRCGFEFEYGELWYNKFRTVVSYTTSTMPIHTMEAIQGAEKLNIYDSLDADVIQSFNEFALVSKLFYAMKECACSEQSQRMSSMDAATKNAGEMIDKLTMTYNRTRQAVITRELIEIISGAAAL